MLPIYMLMHSTSQFISFTDVIYLADFVDGFSERQLRYVAKLRLHLHSRNLK